MEQFDENVYVVDLGDTDTAPEIIFKLSNILDNEETRNKRICLKLGNVNLNQAQLLSVKSLINGIDSTLSLLDTKSPETEKVAMSLGIIVSNVTNENASDILPEAPYKMAEDIVEENIADIQQEQQNDNNEPETAESSLDNEAPVEDSENTKAETSNDSEVQEDAELNEQNLNEETEKNNIVQDELDVIFSSSPAQNTFYEIESEQNDYTQEQEMDDIVVPEAEYTKEDIELETFPTKYIKQTIRSGQVINYEGNIVIIGDCHPGCEITAFGDITVWGVLSGIAHAGAGGNQKARVRALKMNAIQLRIANCYSRRPDSLNTVYIEKTNSFTPEEARILNGEIVVFKIND